MKSLTKNGVSPVIWSDSEKRWRGFGVVYDGIKSGLYDEELSSTKPVKNIGLISGQFMRKTVLVILNVKFFGLAFFANTLVWQCALASNVGDQFKTFRGHIYTRVTYPPDGPNKGNFGEAWQDGIDGAIWSQIQSGKFDNFDFRNTAPSGKVVQKSQATDACAAIGGHLPTTADYYIMLWEFGLDDFYGSLNSELLNDLNVLFPGIKEKYLWTSTADFFTRGGEAHFDGWMFDGATGSFAPSMWRKNTAWIQCVNGPAPEPKDAINICDRGPVGDYLATVTYSKNCSKVSRSSLQAVDYLGIDSSQIDNLPDDVFKGLDQVQKIVIAPGRSSRKPRITQISKYAFRGLNLCSLDIRGSKFSEIATDSFRSTIGHCLSELVLTNNQITSIQPGAFSGFGNLKRVDLRDNQIASLPSQLFEESPIDQLSLSGNPISNISKSQLGLSPSSWVDIPWKP